MSANQSQVIPPELRKKMPSSLANHSSVILPLYDWQYISPHVYKKPRVWLSRTLKTSLFSLFIKFASVSKMKFVSVFVISLFTVFYHSYYRYPKCHPCIGVDHIIFIETPGYCEISLHYILCVLCVMHTTIKTYYIFVHQ